MNDEAFHLTPLDVRRYEFGHAFRGYDRERVDQFREQCAEELERLSRLNQELDTKARGFHEQLRAFRDRDKALNDALISAQQLRVEMGEQSEREATLVMREAQSQAERHLHEARIEADRLVEDARAEVRRLEEQVVAIQRTQRSYVAQLRTLAERHLAEVAMEAGADDNAR